MTRTVLAVDDDVSVLQTLTFMLEDLGCEVIAASDPADALTILHNHEEITLLVTDVNMPGMNGIDLARSAQKFRANLKVLLVSGLPQMTGYPLLQKPFREEDLARVMAANTGLC